MSKILCITDLDGTFVKNSQEISDEDLAAYHLLQGKADFAIATGRSTKEIQYIIDTYHLDVQHAIGFNGALIKSGDEVVHEDIIPQAVMKRIFAYIEKEQLVFDVLDGQARLGNFFQEDRKRLWNMEILHVPTPYEVAIPQPIYKINIRPTKETAQAHLAKLKQNFPELEISLAGRTRIELTHRGVSKGQALKHIRLPEQQVVAFGDSGNDLALFEHADIAYCMAHAPEEVQAKATYVVASFAEAVNHLMGQPILSSVLEIS